MRMMRQLIRLFSVAALVLGVATALGLGAASALALGLAGSTPGIGGDTDSSATQQPDPQQQTSRISPRQSEDLFRSVSQILTFASTDTKLPIRHDVKRRLITRAEVEKYVLSRFHDSKDVKNMQRQEIVLKKFGLLDRDFQLEPFLVSLLTEQVAGYYDNKTKTVNLLDWVTPDEQRPVIAHELTHALQDQHTDLEKWEPGEPDTVPKNVTEDNQRLASDEEDTAKDAVLEGQAMAVYLDYSMRSSGKSLITVPNISDNLDATDSSPVMAKAPRLLQESLLFPYRYGLTFEQTLMKDKGRAYAFAGVLDRPPTSSFEIMNPQFYEQGKAAPLLRMPDVHDVLNADYKPYDIGVMGELDVHILTGLFGGDDEAAALTPQWNGGLYYALQNKNAKTNEEKASTKSISLIYLSAWREKPAAEEFARLYGREIGMKYSSVTRDPEAETSAGEQVYRTDEGPVLIALQGRKVFVSESFDLDLARKLEFLFFGAQNGASTQIANAPDLPVAGPAAIPISDPGLHLAGMISSYGLMKTALSH